MDLKFHEFLETEDMISWWATCGTRDFVAPSWTAASMRSISSLRTWAAAGSIFIGEHDAGLTHNSALVKLNVLDSCYKRRMKYFLFNRLPAGIRSPNTACLRPLISGWRAAKELAIKGQSLFDVAHLRSAT